MKKKVQKFAPCLCLFVMLTGCARNKKQFEESISSQDTNPISETTITKNIEQSTTTILENTSDFENSTTQTETKLSSESAVSTLAIPDFTLPTAPKPSPEQQGGQGGQEFAETPLPQYFTYRFQEDAVSMRLAGGNYQTIFYDFSDALEHDVNALYYLEDFNFDGWLDLAVPSKFQEDQITYSVFLWDNENAQYHEKPLLFSNPVVDSEKQKIKCYERSGKEIAISTAYGLVNGNIQAIWNVKADFSALSLVTEDMVRGTIQTQNFQNSNELETAFLESHES